MTRNHLLDAAAIGIVVTLLLAASAARATAESASLRIQWLPLTLNQKYIEDMVKVAPEYGVSAFELSHTLVMSADDVIGNESRRQAVLKAMDAMKAGGFGIWCWTHELSRLPPELGARGTINLKDEALKKYLTDKYSNFVTKVLPGLDGLVVTYAETGIPVYMGVTPDQARVNLHDLTAILRDAVAPYGKRLVVRDFVYRKEELEIMKQAIGAMPAEVAIMSKIVPHDWQPYYPISPTIGALGAREQWIEFDMGFEFEGQNILPYSDPNLLLTWLNESWAKGARTVCLRLDRYHADEGKSSLTTPWGKLNLTTFSAFKKNPSVKAEEIIASWEKGQFPGAWKVLELSTAITRRAMFPKRMWYQNHSNLPSFSYARSHIKGGSATRLAGWTGLKEDQMAEDLCDKPTPQWYQEILAEDQQSVQDLKEIEGILSRNSVDIAKFPIWDNALRALRVYADLFAASKRAYFAIRLHQNMPEAMSKEKVVALIDEFEATAKKHGDLPQAMRFTSYVSPQSTVSSLRSALNQ